MGGMDMNNGILVDRFKCPHAGCSWSIGTTRPTVKFSDEDIEHLRSYVMAEWDRHVALDHPEQEGK